MIDKKTYTRIVEAINKMGHTENQLCLPHDSSVP